MGFHVAVGQFYSFRSFFEFWGGEGLHFQRMRPEGAIRLVLTPVAQETFSGKKFFFGFDAFDEADGAFF